MQQSLIEIALQHAPADSSGFLSKEAGTDSVLSIVVRAAQGSELGICASNLLFRLLPSDVGQVCRVKADAHSGAVRRWVPTRGSR